MNHYIYRNVKVIKTGKIGIVIDVTADSVLVEFSDETREWYCESDILLIEDDFY